MACYFAQFIPQDDGESYTVDFPDLEGCFTDGSTLSEAIANAEECLRCYIGAAHKEGEKLPEPSPYTTAKRLAEARCSELGISVNDGTFYQAVVVKPVAEKPVQISISILPSLLKEIDAAAKLNGLTRSGFLATAARKYAGELSA